MGKRTAAALVTAETLGDIGRLAPSWELHLRAEGLAESTIATYLRTLGDFRGYLVERAMPTAVAAISGEHFDAYRVHVRDRCARGGRSDGSSTSNTYRAHLLQFFKWCAEEGERSDNPVTRLKRMREPQKMVPIVEDDTMDRLLNGWSGRDFISRRDLALLSTYVDTGGRRSELLTELDDLDLRRSVLRVKQKGKRENWLPLGKKTVRDLDRYLRVRAAHAHADSPYLWLGLRGPLTASGIYQVIESRCAKVGIEHINPHRFRHTFAHQWLANGGNEQELAHIAGWTSTQMVARYARSAAGQRAREAHRRLSPRDRF